MATYTTAWLDFQSLSQSGAGDSWTREISGDPAGPSYEEAFSLLDKSGSSALLYISNIDYPTIEPADTLVGIEFRFTRFAEAGSPIDEIIRLSESGSSNLAKPSTWPTTATAESYGGAADLWGTSLTTAGLDNALGVEIQVLNTSASDLALLQQSNAQIRFTFEEASSGLTATLAAQEAGSDTASASLSVVVSGSLSVQETGQDVASGTLGVSVSGILSAQEAGPDTFSGSVTTGPAPILATLAAQEVGQDTASAVASVLVSGSLTAQEVGADVFNGSTALAISATLSAQEVGADVFAGAAFTIQPSGRRFEFPNQAENGGQVTTQASPAIISQARAGVVLSQNNGAQILDHARSGHIVGA